VSSKCGRPGQGIAIIEPFEQVAVAAAGRAERRVFGWTRGLPQIGHLFARSWSSWCHRLRESAGKGKGGVLAAQADSCRPVRRARSARSQSGPERSRAHRRMAATSSSAPGSLTRFGAAQQQAEPLRRRGPCRKALEQRWGGSSRATSWTKPKPFIAVRSCGQPAAPRPAPHRRRGDRPCRPASGNRCRWSHARSKRPIAAASGGMAASAKSARGQGAVDIDHRHRRGGLMARTGRR
jgi:hypothetical protein